MHQRTAILREHLNREQASELSRIQHLRHEHEQATTGEPCDILDVARSIEESEMHASLIERSQERWRAIDSALRRLDAGTYGDCVGCGEAISVERLELLPFTQYCVECQGSFERSRPRASARTSTLGESLPVGLEDDGAHDRLRHFGTGRSSHTLMAL